MKVFTCFLIVLLTDFNAIGQNLWNRLGILYDGGIEYYLFPKTSECGREILFVSKPSFNSPEYSLAIEKKGNAPVLKLRSFKSNYWELVFSKRGEKLEKITSETDIFEVKISKKFESKLKSFFKSVLKDSLITRIFDTYDGTTYYAQNNKYNKVIREFDFTANRSYYKLVEICESVAYDLKINNLKEKWYINRINEELKERKKRIN